LRDARIPVPEAGLACTVEEAGRIADQIGRPVVVKAQVLTGGRYKAGGIRFAARPKEAEEAAKALLGSQLRGFSVESVLVEEKLDIEKEYYLGVIVDDSYKTKGPMLVFSTEGGIDIEETASKTPEKISQIKIDVLRGVRSYDAYNLILKLGIHASMLQPLGEVVRLVYDAFRRYEARVLEVNPVVVTRDGRIFAADCRMTIDDSAVPRHPELGVVFPRETDRPPTKLDRTAWTIEEGDYRGVAYFLQIVPEIKESGYIGFHGIGGGGALLAADALLRHGLKIANYADTSGNPTAAKVYRIAKIILSQPGIEGYFLGGACIASQEQWHHAHGIVKALREELKDRQGFPVIVLLAGNKEKEALEIIRKGLGDLPIRFELYGRDHVYSVDYLAERMKMLVDEYAKSFKAEG